MGTTLTKRKYTRRIVLGLEAVVYTTYETEFEYLSRKTQAGKAKGCDLPSPQEIEEMKRVIREENEASDRLKAELTNISRIGTHPRSLKEYKFDPTGQRGRHGKII